MDTRRYKCCKCDREYEAREIKYISMNKIACVHCLGKKPSEAESPYFEEKKHHDGIIEYVCGKCNYSFKRKKSFLVLSCPYCGSRESLSKSNKKAAEELIRESLDKRYE